MKKMIMALAIVLTVGTTQAASVSWSTGKLYVPTAVTGVFGSEINATSLQYFATVTFYADNTGVMGSALSGVTGNTGDTSTSLSDALAGTAAATPAFANNGSYWAQVVVTTAVNGNWSMTSTAARFTIGGTGNGNIIFGVGTGFDTVDNKMPTIWTAVPEPTSMALLALGVAAVGLRRRLR